MHVIDTNIYKQRLLDRKAELLERLENIEHELDEPASPDSEDRATEREDDEVLEGIGNSGLTEITAIEAALERIEQGTYGQCIICGEAISPERLDIIPTAVKCKKCM